MAIFRIKTEYNFEGPPNKTFSENFSFNGNSVKASRLFVNFPLGKFIYNSFSGLPSTTVRDVSWSPDGRLVAFACSGVSSPTTNPTVAIYYFDGTAFTKLTTPAGLRIGGDSYSIAWSPDGRYLALGGSGTYKIDIYEFYYETAYTGNANFYQIDEIPPPQTYSSTSTCTGLSWSPDSRYLAASMSKEPFNYIYELVEDEPASSLVQFSALNKNYSVSSSDCSWSSDGRYLAVGYKRPPYVGIYQFDGKTFEKLPESPDVPKSPVNSLQWSPDGQALAVAHSKAPVISAFSFDKKELTLLPISPARGSSDAAYRVTWTPDGRYLGATFLSTPKFDVYTFDGVNFKKIDYAQSLLEPNSTGAYAMEWGPDGENLVLGSARTKSSAGLSKTSNMLELSKPRNKPS